MKINDLSELIGKRVIVTADFGTLGYLIVERHLKARRVGAVGVVQGWVPGHGGDIVFVIQEDTPVGDEPIGVYSHLRELEFYSDGVLTFANDKAKKIQIISDQLKSLKESGFIS